MVFRQACSGEVIYISLAVIPLTGVTSKLYTTEAGECKSEQNYYKLWLDGFTFSTPYREFVIILRGFWEQF